MVLDCGGGASAGAAGAAVTTGGCSGASGTRTSDSSNPKGPSSASSPPSSADASAAGGAPKKLLADGPGADVAAGAPKNDAAVPPGLLATEPPKSPAARGTTGSPAGCDVGVGGSGAAGCGGALRSAAAVGSCVLGPGPNIVAALTGGICGSEGGALPPGALTESGAGTGGCKGCCGGAAAATGGS